MECSRCSRCSRCSAIALHQFDMPIPSVDSSTLDSRFSTLDSSRVHHLCCECESPSHVQRRRRRVIHLRISVQIESALELSSALAPSIHGIHGIHGIHDLACRYYCTSYVCVCMYVHTYTYIRRTVVLCSSKTPPSLAIAGPPWKGSG